MWASLPCKDGRSGTLPRRRSSAGKKRGPACARQVPPQRDGVTIIIGCGALPQPQNSLRGDAGGVRIALPEGVLAKLLKFFRVGNQAVDASREFARLS